MVKAVKEIIRRLEEMGIDRPKIMSVEALTGYPDPYFIRESLGDLTGLEPDFNHSEGLKAYLLPWKYMIGMAIPYELIPENRTCKAEEISSVSIMAWEWDYHQKIREGLTAALGTEASYVIHIDQGPLPERYLAMQMGIAEPGRSQMLIHPEYGTAFHLAFILTDLEASGDLEITEYCPGKSFELSKACLNCKACQVHCPSGALQGEAEFKGKGCISAITQKKGLLSTEEMDFLGRQLYGCDICQLSCPVNTPLSRFKKGILPQRKSMNRLAPEALLACTQKTFKAKFGQMGFSWRGLTVSKRNALINIGNYGSLEHLELLNQLIASQQVSENQVLYETCTWAKEKIIKRHPLAK